MRGSRYSVPGLGRRIVAGILAALVIPGPTAVAQAQAGTAAPVLTQWENESNRLTINARLHWAPRPGSDVYLAWNSAWPTALEGGIPWHRPQQGVLIGKLVHYFRL